MAKKKNQYEEDELKGYQNAINNYDPDKTVGIRQYLVNQYGVNNDDIGWKNTDNGGATVTLGGYDLINVGKDQINNERTYTSLGDLQNSIMNYSNKYGYDFKEKHNPETRNYKPDNNYSQEIDRLYNQIMNPGEFEYNVDDDPVYQSYESKYRREGQKAMENTLAEASALSGGRNNSWATSAGAQANNYYMQQLTDKIPTLEQNAYNRYLQDMQNKMQAYNVANSRENQDYNRFMNERNYDLGIQQNRAAGEAESQKLAEQIRQFDTNMGYNYDKLSQDQNQFDSNMGYNYDKLNTSNQLEQTKLAIQQAYNQGRLSVDQANTALRQAELDHRKQQDSISNQFRANEIEIKRAAEGEKVNEETLGAAYHDMMSSNDPKQWLINNSSYMDNDELKALEKLMPNDDLQATLEMLLSK